MNSRPLSPARWLLLLLLASAFCAALLCPLLILAAGHYPVLNEWTRGRHSRLLVRALELFFLLFLFLFRSRLDLQSAGAMGLACPLPRAGRDFFSGTAIGLFSCLAVILLRHFCGAQVFSGAGKTTPEWIFWGFECLAGAGLVSLAEEIIFRAGLYRILSRSLTVRTASWLGAALFAGVHFIRPVENLPGPPEFFSGFVLLADMLLKIPENLSPELFTGLFLSGLALTAAYIRSSAIYLGAGLHAAWVMGSKINSELTVSTLSPPSPVWGSSALITGAISWTALILIYLLLSRKKTAS